MLPSHTMEKAGGKQSLAHAQLMVMLTVHFVGHAVCAPTLGPAKEEVRLWV